VVFGVSFLDRWWVRFGRTLGIVIGVVLVNGVCAIAPASAASEVPDFMDIVVDRGEAPSASEIGANNILALDVGMNRIYTLTLAKYKEHMRQRVPIILATFSDTGGSMTLYPPGKKPIEADPVPPIYALVKSVSHSTMAVYQLVAPYILDPSDTSWRGSMQTYVAEIKAARGTLDALEVDDDVRKRLRRMLDAGVEFLETCLKSGSFNLESLTKFAHSMQPDIVKNVALAARTQVEHWEGVLREWQNNLGSQWNRTYAATNTLYVTGQNNILFTILAQFMGKEAIDDRLILVGTTEFTTTQETLMDVLARIVADRSIGKVFFRDYYLMDAELLGGAARHAIEAHATKTGKKALMPTLAPFHTHAWPWPTDPSSGVGPSKMSEIPGN